MDNPVFSPAQNTSEDIHHYRTHENIPSNRVLSHIDDAACT